MTSTWHPLSSHVSQLEDWGDGHGLNGQANCAPAALARFLREAGFPWPGTDHSLIAHVRERLTGVPEAPYQGYVTTAQVEAYLLAAGIPTLVSTDPRAILRPWAFCLVRGRRLAPAQYPPLWFPSDEPDHFILTLPGGLANDPLAYWNGQQDARYTPASLQAAIAGGVAYLLPDPESLAWDPATRVAHTRPDESAADYAAAARVAHVSQLAQNVPVHDCPARWQQIAAYVAAQPKG